ncbi:MAG: site-2 protease family protein [Planctomycetaceae bacterium]|jgi:regulator of sigma E protease|nr:site-2 protease family protein [Planctomycetaceae bacterium]
MVSLAFLLAFSLDAILNVSYVVLGLGLVIFFHELGHFAVAKCCDVNVERFSIGFGPVLWRIKHGETEYVISWIPFGGYVKMLGQDDIDPSQLTSDEIAEDPRSYSAKSVFARMAIISAGVIMNLITGLFFYAGAYGLGVESSQPIVGLVQTGLPAWQAGIQRGDRITRINGERIASFDDIILGVALSPSNRDLFLAPATLADGLAPGPAGELLRAEFSRQQIRLPHNTIVVTDTPGRWFVKSGTTRLFTLTKTAEGVHVAGNLLAIEGLREGREMSWNVLPDGKGTRRKIGLGSEYDIRLFGGDEVGGPAFPGWAADEAQPAFQNNDRLRQLGETPIGSVAEMRDHLARHADQELVYHVEREGSQGLMPIRVPARRFRTLGLSMDIGRITAIQDKSPADLAGIKVGDKLITVNGRDVGKDVNPLELPNDFARLQGEKVEIEVLREQPTGEPQTVKVSVTPENRPGWLDRPETPNVSLSIPALGIACHCTVNVLAVVPDSPAAKAKIKPGEQIRRVELTLRLPTLDTKNKETRVIEFADSKTNWAHAVWMMQFTHDGPVTLQVVGENGQTRDVQLTPQRNPDRAWFLPQRGTRHYTLTEIQQATGVVAAARLSVDQAKTTLLRIWLTLRSLFTGDISVTELHGPIGIARAAYSVAEHSLSRLLLFLGFLSFNLAVINFLPIPVLDGGHMVFLAWEAITRRRPNERVLVAATYCGVAFVLTLMVTVIFIDLERIPAIKQVVESVFG